MYLDLSFQVIPSGHIKIYWLRMSNGYTSSAFRAGISPITQSSRLINDATYHAYKKSCPLVGAVSQIKLLLLITETSV